MTEIKGSQRGDVNFKGTAQDVFLEGDKICMNIANAFSSS